MTQPIWGPGEALPGIDDLPLLPQPIACRANFVPIGDADEELADRDRRRRQGKPNAETEG
jgi:hypothetical protein